MATSPNYILPMASAKNTGDSFGTFLETLHGESLTNTGDPGVRLLSVLAEVGPSTRAELFKLSQLDLVSFAAGLEAVAASGFVASGGPSGKEVVDLTPSGREVLSVRS